MLEWLSDEHWYIAHRGETANEKEILKCQFKTSRDCVLLVGLIGSIMLGQILWQCDLKVWTELLNSKVGF
jgi:hypothetical protein